MTVLEALEQEFRKTCNKLLEYVDHELVEFATSDIYFGNTALTSNSPGIHVMVSSQEYTLMGVGDMGEVHQELHYTKLFDVFHHLYGNVTYRLAAQLSKGKAFNNGEWRRVLFGIQLDLLKLLGDEYYQYELKEIQKILEKNPFQDNLPDNVLYSFIQ